MDSGDTGGNTGNFKGDITQNELTRSVGKTKTRHKRHKSEWNQNTQDKTTRQRTVTISVGKKECCKPFERRVGCPSWGHKHLQV